MPETVRPGAVLLFQDDKPGLFYSIDKRDLRWQKSALPLTQDGSDFVPKEDWAKIIHLEQQKYLVCGGSTQINEHQTEYSTATMVLDL